MTVAQESARIPRRERAIAFVLDRCLVSTSYASVRATYNNRGTAVTRSIEYKEGERRRATEREKERGGEREVEESPRALPLRSALRRLARFNKHITKLYDYERSRKRPAPYTDDLYFQLDPRWIGRALLIDGMPKGEEVGGWDRGGTGPHGNYF